jgi:hypothetical protein
MTDSAQLLAEAAAVAREGASFAAHFEQAPDPQSLIRDEIRHLAQYTPGAGCAAGLIGISATPVQPLELPHLTSVGDLLTTPEQVLEHWRRRPHDAVGVPAGRQSNGSTIFALSFADDATWKVWLTEHATVVDRFRDRDTGNDVVRTRAREVGSHRPGPR